MKIKIFKPVLFLLSLTVTISALAEASDTDTKPPAVAAEPAKEKAAEEVNKRYEPATRFTPTEKLRADDTVAFPVDI